MAVLESYSVDGCSSKGLTLNGFASDDCSVDGCVADDFSVLRDECAHI
jgi:hypothetical protein